MDTVTGTCRIGDDDQDRPCEMTLDNSPGLKSWYLDTCVSREESDRLLHQNLPVSVEIHLDDHVLAGKAILSSIHTIPEGERSNFYPLGAHMVGSGPLEE